MKSNRKTLVTRALQVFLVLGGVGAPMPSSWAQESHPSDASEPAGVEKDLGDFQEPGGLSAKEAARLAMESSNTVAKAMAAQRIAEAASDQALVAAMPRLDLSARYTRLSPINQASLTGGAPSAADIAATQMLIDGVADPNAQILFNQINQQNLAFSSFEFPVLLNQYVLNARLTFPVSDVFLSLLPAYAASENFAEAETLRVESERRSVALSGTEAFYNYVRARSALLVAESSVAQVETQRARIETLVKGGVLPAVDLTRIDAQLAAARVGVAQARGNVAVAAHMLRTLLHLPEKPNQNPDEIAVNEDLSRIPASPTSSRADLIATALAERVEVQAVRKLAKARRQVASARASQMLPHLSLQGNIDYANPNQRIFPQQEEFNMTWDVGAVLSWSPNDFFDAEAKTRGADAETLQAQEDLQSIEDAVALDVTTGVENLNTALASLEAAEAAVTAAEETHRIRSQQLTAGAIVASDLIDAEQDLTKARIQRIDALVAAHVAHARLQRALGR
ncbi:MAG: TolC family protein [Myxococcales bacterium]|nr:TolC family protein [Myxococcales bacterium]